MNLSDGIGPSVRLPHLFTTHRDVHAIHEETLPARDGVGADDRVDGFEVVADVSGRAPRALADLVAEGFGDVLEEAGFVDGFEGFEIFGEGGGEAVVDFVATTSMNGYE